MTVQGRKYYQQSKKAWLAEHPVCCYCGQKATTEDHMPGRNFFRSDAAPEGYRVPACGPCNGATGKDEMVAAVVASMPMSPEQTDPEFLKKVKEMANNCRDVAKEWGSYSDVGQITSINGRFGMIVGNILHARGMRHGRMGPATQRALARFWLKAGAALYYLHVGRPLVGTTIYQIDDKVGFDRNIFLERLKLAPLGASLTRSGQDLSDQFTYRYNVSENHGAVYAVLEFPAGQFIYTVIAMDVQFAQQAPELEQEPFNKNSATFPQPQGLPL